MNRQTKTLLALGALTAALLATTPARADEACVRLSDECPFAEGCRRCYSAADDRDGDGYARAGATACKARRTGLSCPAGYVYMDGDCNDDDSTIHPRRAEIAFNDVDNDCDDKVDQTTFVYSAAGFGTSVSGFDLHARVNENAVFNAAALYAKVEYAPLADSLNSQYTGYIRVDGLSAQNVVVVLPVRGLLEAKVYRARVRFYSRQADGTYVRVGAVSDWYYTTTTGRTTEDVRRTAIVLRALKEAEESELGNVGYLGRTEDGTRYGDRRGGWWCSEFYSWSAGPQVAGIAGLGTAPDLIDFFTDVDSFLEPADIQTRARRGDYLPQDGDGDGDANHSSMFLAYDSSRNPDLVWTVEGNTTGETLAGGNQAAVKKVSLDRFTGVGHITPSLLGIPPPPVR
jgi:hypothetical protein